MIGRWCWSGDGGMGGVGVVMVGGWCWSGEDGLLVLMVVER